MAKPFFFILARYVSLVETTENSRTGGMAGHELFQSNTNTHSNRCYSCRVV